MTFSFNYFFCPEFLFISLLQFFFHKMFQWILHHLDHSNICPWNCIFNFFNHKNFFRSIWCVSFTKNIFVFGNSYMIPPLDLWSLLECNSAECDSIKSIYVLSLTSTGLILMALWYVLLYSFAISSNLLIYTFFWYWSHVVVDFSL